MAEPAPSAFQQRETMVALRAIEVENKKKGLVAPYLSVPSIRAPQSNTEGHYLSSAL
jgi:hypothetical protein